MKGYIKYVAAAAVLLIVLGVGNHIIRNSMNEGVEANPDTKMGGDVETIIGQKEDAGSSILSEQEIAAADISYSALELLEEKIQKETDYKAITKEIEEWIEDGAEGFLLSDTSNLQISTFNMPLINLADLTPGNIVYEFLFDDEEPVGYVMFFMADHKLSYSISLNRANTYGYYFDFLTDHQNQSFIVLTDGFTSYFLSEDNLLYHASTGNITDDISIIGDCYHAFSYEKIEVSYEDIMNQVMGVQDTP